MNIIKVKDFDSMQAITVGLARNGYMVTADSVTDENYKEHWEIKYCEFSEMNKIPVNNGSDWDGDYISSMEIHNKDNTKGVKCKILPDEKPVTSVDEETGDNTDSTNDEKPLVENERDIVDPNPYGLVPRHNDPDIPNFKPKDVSDIITDENMTVITSVSGN
jgi:hypothetical protein